MRARRYLVTLAAGLPLAAALAQPACARQDAAARESQQQQQQAPAEAAEWQRRVQAAEARVAQAPSDVGARRELVQLLLVLGRTEAAERAARGSESAELANALGEALYARGAVPEAEAAFRRAIDGRASDAMQARLNLGLLLDRRGERAAAQQEFERLVRWYSDSPGLGAADLVAIGTAVRHLGATNPQLFQDAVRAYEEAVRANGADTEARLAEASLFLEKYNSTDAQDLIREVLQRAPGHPEALLLQARAKKFDGSDEALSLVRRSLAIAPEYVPARVYHAELLLELEDHDGAKAEAERALRANPASLEALAVLSAAQRLEGDERAAEATARRALALNPRYAGLYVAAAEAAVQQRRYQDAAQLAQRALELDSADAQARTQLGMNQFRLGRIEEARRTLERAFAADPYNAWVKNTLDLLDTYPQYVERAGPRAQLFLHGDEADLLALYMAPLAEEAIDSLARRYGYRPRGPVRVEVFPRHADFSVRTVGLTGLGALGVAFGNQLVMDSPAARDRGEFNWGSTLWHELAHTFTLGASRNRVPRWLTEGLSVYEERRARAGWGEEITPSFAAAYGAGKTMPVSRLNQGFVRPSYPEQIIHSYYQASLVVEYIEKEHGWEAIRRMLDAFGDGRTNEQVLRSVLRTEPEELDRRFDAYVRQRFAKQLAAVATTGDVPPYVRQLTEARALIEGGRLDQAKRLLQQARDAFPEFAAPGSPYHLLADLHERAGDRAAAAAELERAFSLHDSDYDAMLRAAALRFALGDTARATAALERALYVHPYDPALHAQLADAYTSLRRFEDAVRERRAVLALKPVDAADARYRLALALERAGRAGEARSEVLRALEVAPNFAAAQELLLRLSGGGR